MSASKGASVPPESPPSDASVPPNKALVPSKRSVSQSCQRRRAEAQKHNVNAWKHGAYATVHATPETALECQLTFISHPHLDPIADLRTVEVYALLSWQLRKAIAEIDRSGYSQTMTAWASRLAGQVERMERSIRDLDKERQAELRKGPIVDLSRYLHKPEPEQP